MTPHVWVARAGDVESVTGLISGFRDWLGYHYPTDDRIGEVVRVLIEDHGTEYLLGAPERHAAPVGVCQLRYRLCVWTGADDCWLEDLYVREDARRGGFGRALVDAAVERARVRGCRRIDLDVNEQNPEALAFYRSMGFTTEPKPPGRTLYVARRLDS
jgi:ribosomal protein S18 acetylase RimI-like enzyme